MKKFAPRPDWSVYEGRWLKNYDAANYGGSLSSYVLKTTHRLIENDQRLEAHYDSVLELGAGTMAHLPNVRHGYNEYIASDHDAKVISWLKERSWGERVKIEQLAGGNLPYEDNKIDRLIATHVLEHITEPVIALEEWVRVVRPGGVISLILPCDPGLAWRFGRTLGPRRAAHKVDLPYDYYMAVEHVNSIYNLKAIIRHHFADREEKWWPTSVPFPDVNLIFAVNCYL